MRSQSALKHGKSAMNTTKSTTSAIGAAKKEQRSVLTSSRGGDQSNSMISLGRPVLDSKKTSVMSSKQRDWGLLDSEKTTYGDRCPTGYEKIALLGKGGCAIVWLCREVETGRRVALKQFPKPKGVKSGGTLDSSARNEIEIGKSLFSENAGFDGYAVDPHQYPGIKHITRLFGILDEPKDVWLSYEVGGESLNSLMFSIKGASHNGERVYNVIH